MAATPSTMLPLGTTMPDFDLPDVTTGNRVSSKQLSGHPAVVIAFVCNHCPFVKHIADELASLGRDCKSQGVAFIAINSNDVENYPDDAPDKMEQAAEEWHWTFPYLYDETQDVAKSFKAACTPDFYVFDSNLQLVYRGQLDDSRPKTDIPVTGKDLRAAINAAVQGEQQSTDQKPSMGCNIKWKKGNEPEYA